MMNLCYQVGVTISRSSLEFIIIKKVYIVTILQAINFVLWAIIAWNKNLALGLEFVFMIWVGLMGGASYVNVLYQTLEDPKIEKKEKEVSINVISMFNTGGIVSATLISLLLENTIYSDK